MFLAASYCHTTWNQFLHQWHWADVSSNV